jgi:hypothetical protein
MANGVNAIANLLGRTNANGALLVSLDGGSLLLGAFTFATLPATTAGRLAVVTDANQMAFGAVITGGGPRTVLAFYNGTNWTVAGR